MACQNTISCPQSSWRMSHLSVRLAFPLPQHNSLLAPFPLVFAFCLLCCCLALQISWCKWLLLWRFNEGEINCFLTLQLNSALVFPQHPCSNENQLKCTALHAEAVNSVSWSQLLLKGCALVARVMEDGLQCSAYFLQEKFYKIGVNHKEWLQWLPGTLNCHMTSLSWSATFSALSVSHLASGDMLSFSSLFLWSWLYNADPFPWFSTNDTCHE